MSFSLEIQDSTIEPPYDELIIPTGTFSRLWRNLAKKKATAENPATVFGEHGVHSASTSFLGEVDVARLILKRRMSG
jgi:hypothetical protein